MTSAFYDLLTPAEAASVLRVDTSTLTRYQRAGKLTACRTLGGHRRYSAAEVHALLNPSTDPGEPHSIELVFPGWEVRDCGEFFAATATCPDSRLRVTLRAAPGEIRGAIKAQIAEWSNP